MNHSPDFKKRRLQNWLLLGLMYGFFYASRYNLASIQVAFMEKFGIEEGFWGTLIGAGAVCYGIAVFVNGPLADTIGGKRAILFGAAGAAYMNLLFGACTFLVKTPLSPSASHSVEYLWGMRQSTVLATLLVLWGANNYFQSFGALSIVKINAAWFHVRERGTFGGLFGVMIQSGRAFAKKLGPLILAYALPLRWAFWVPAFMLTVMFIATYLGVEDSPANAKLGDFDPEDGSAQESEKVTLKFLIFKIFAKPSSWIVAFSSMCLGVIRVSSENWDQKFITSVFKIKKEMLNAYGPNKILIYVSPLASILGSIFAGYVTDRVFKGRRAPVILISFVMLGLSLFLLHKFIYYPWASCIVYASISFFIQCCHSLIAGVSSMDLGGRRAAATAAGLFDGAQYLAAGFVSVILGKIMQAIKERKMFLGYSVGNEFEAWPLLLLPFAIIGACLISTLWNKKPGNRGGH